MEEIINLIFLLWDPYGIVGYGPLDEYNDFTKNLMDLMNEKGVDENAIMNHLRKLDILNTSNSAKIEVLARLLKNIYVYRL